MSVTTDLMTHESFGETQTGKDILGKINFYDKEENALEKFTNKKVWKKGNDSVETRVLVSPRVSVADISAGKYDLAEAVAPSAVKLEYVSIRHGIRNYGTRMKYTRHAVYYNPDSIVTDSADSLGQWAVGMKNALRASAYLSTGSVITAGTGSTAVMDTFDNAMAAFMKLKIPFVDNAKWVAFVNTEVYTELLKELRAIGEKLPNNLKEAIIMDGYVGEYAQFEIHTLDDIAAEQLTVTAADSTTKQKIIFVGRTKGTHAFPVDEFSMEGGTELINNPLGTSLVLEHGSSTDYTSDDNHQGGSVAINLMGYGDYLIDPRSVAVASVALDSIDTSGIKTGAKDARTADPLTKETVTVVAA